MRIELMTLCLQGIRSNQLSYIGMHRVGFEPTKHDAIELESIPFDQLGNLCLTIKF